MNQTLLSSLVEKYLDLESFEATEDLLDLCGTMLDQRALVLLKQRLAEEQERMVMCETRGYVRMQEKSAQLVAALRPLIVYLEDGSESKSTNVDA
jgi:hypothetical protein